MLHQKISYQGNLFVTLYSQLQSVRSEEDVKDAYIKALGLKKYTKGLIDIQSKEIWFEAKDTRKNSTYAMFTQLLHYVQVALDKGEQLPPLLAVIDTEKAALMKTEDVVPFLSKKTVKWGKSATKYTQEALDEISAHIGTHFVSFKIATDEDEFLSTVKLALQSGDIIRTQITPANLKQVFDKWVSLIGHEITGVNEEDYALLFFADIMHDGTVSTHANLPAELLHKNGSPVFSLGGKLFELGNKNGYRQFWNIYHKPPRSEYRDYLLERRDSLIPLDERSFKGAFYTPLQVVDKAYDKLAETLGKNWQKEYVVWDMCCGVGNLEVKHSNHRNVFMSTLDQADIDVMKATKTCVAAHRFQYDYLNDDITADGKIDYNLTNKVPKELRAAISAGKKLLVLINPPYAESASALGSENKVGVASTRIGANLKHFGFANRELFTQFIARIMIELPTATVAMFSKLKYVNATNFDKFRKVWKAQYLDGFVIPSKVFDGLSGNFPIGFLIWKTDHLTASTAPITQISVEVLDRKAQPIGNKLIYNLPKSILLTDWIDRPKKNSLAVIPLKNAITPAIVTKDVRGTKWADGAIGCLLSSCNDLQHAVQQTALFSSGYGSPGAFLVTPDSLWKVAVVFTVRRIVKPTWLNDRDQFLQPTSPLPEQFINDCLVWMLFNGSNLTAGANDLEWNGRNWSLVNHFIPFSESAVGATDRFESDFMAEYLKDKTQSPEAKAVLDAGCVLWTAYHSQVDMRAVRDRLKLNRSDAGWYQIRNALAERNSSGSTAPISFANFNAAYETLGDIIRPQVYSLGFLR